jgi:biopolymer transport protein ExbD
VAAQASACGGRAGFSLRWPRRLKPAATGREVASQQTIAQGESTVMSWSVRHAGSPRSVPNLSLAQIIIGLRDGFWEPMDEVMGPNDTKWVAIESHPQLEAIAGELEPPEPAEHPDETHLDMNPLIDVCLVLLIFFILTTTYNAVMKVINIPTTSDAQKGAIRVVKPGEVSRFMVHVVATAGRDGARIEIEGGPPVGLAEFPDKLKEWMNKTGIRKREMLLEISGVSWGTAIKIQDAAKSVGIDKINYLQK